MDIVEKRRHPRVSAFNEETAVLHAGSTDVPVKLIDLGRTGVLCGCFNSIAEEKVTQIGERVFVTLQLSESVIDLQARVVRRTPESVALEFTDVRAETGELLDEKIKTMQRRHRAANA